MDVSGEAVGAMQAYLRLKRYILPSGVAREALQAAAPFLSALEPSAARELALVDALEVAKTELQAWIKCADENGLCVTSTPHVIEHIDIALASLSSPDHADAGKVEGDGIERGKFYHHHWPMGKLLEARRDGLVDHSGGEAWRYEYSHKDENGKYDVLYRPVKNSAIPARLPSAPASEGEE